jgi:hypothetical protein
MVTIHTTSFNIKIDFYVWLSQQTAFVSLYSIRRLLLQMEAHILCELRT